MSGELLCEKNMSRLSQKKQPQIISGEVSSKTVRPESGKYKLSKWKYIVIIFTLIFLGISAVPNLFQNYTTLLIDSPQPIMAECSAAEYKDVLEARSVSVKSVDCDKKFVSIRLSDETDYRRAKEILRSHLGREVTVSKVNQNDQPDWLTQLGAEPIELGLDLSGGVLVVLKVDLNQAAHESMNSIKYEIDRYKREQQLRGLSIQVDKNNGLKILSSKVASLNRIERFIAKQFPELILNHKSVQSLTFALDAQSSAKFNQQVMQQTLSTMRQRIDEIGITEAIVQRQGENRIRIEIPGLKDPTLVEKYIGATASLKVFQPHNSSRLSFKDELGQKIEVDPKPIFTGENIKDAQAGRDEMGIPLVNLRLDATGGEKMLKHSSKNVGNQMVTVLSEYVSEPSGTIQRTDRIISIATIQSQLGNRFSITNLDSMQQAQTLAMSIRAGSLAAPVSIVKKQTIDATLGKQNIINGFKALALGLGVTLLFMALWYRKLGLVANISLLLNLVCLVGLLSLLPGAVLTLPGIAGLVLTIGMAVDTNVLIFERIKEEKKKKIPDSLVLERGYNNAMSTIVDANLTTLFVAVILYGIGFGPVKGFAITLGLGTLTSLFCGVFVSRVLSEWFYLRANRSKDRLKNSNRLITQKQIEGVGQ